MGATIAILPAILPARRPLTGARRGRRVLPRPMPDPSALAGSLLVVALIVVMLWFAIGTQRNVRRGNDLLRWLQHGLPLLGPRTTVRWLGSSVVELRIAAANPPFRDAKLLVVLEPRDLGALWALARRRGRRDFIVLRADLLHPPRGVWEAVAPEAWSVDDRRSDAGRRTVNWGADGGAVEVAVEAGADEARLREAWRRLGSVSGGAWRLTVQPVVPHFEVHFLPPDVRRSGSRGCVEGMIEVARQLSAR